jgi:hypothetical protein
MTQAIKAIIDEFRKSEILAKGETFEEQVRYDVLMSLVLLSNKCSVSQLKTEAAGHLAAKQRSLSKTEDLYQDYQEESRSKYFKPRDLREHLDAMRAPFYVPAIAGGSYGRRSYDYGTQDFTFGESSGSSASTLHPEQMSTVEEAYEFRKAYLPLYIEILQDILQNA